MPFWLWGVCVLIAYCHPCVFQQDARKIQQKWHSRSVGKSSPRKSPGRRQPQCSFVALSVPKLFNRNLAIRDSALSFVIKKQTKNNLVFFFWGPKLAQRCALFEKLENAFFRERSIWAICGPDDDLWEIRWICESIKDWLKSKLPMGFSSNLRRPCHKQDPRHIRRKEVATLDGFRWSIASWLGMYCDCFRTSSKWPWEELVSLLGEYRSIVMDSTHLDKIHKTSSNQWLKRMPLVPRGQFHFIPAK